MVNQNIKTTQKITGKLELRNSLEKFYDTLDGDEQELLSIYLQRKNYESLSDGFDKLLKQYHEDKKDNN